MNLYQINGGYHVVAKSFDAAVKLYKESNGKYTVNKILMLEEDIPIQAKTNDVNLDKY